MSGIHFALAEQGKILALAGEHGEALRHYPAVKVNTAFRRALERAEREGRLALLTPDYLLEHARLGQEGRDRGRPLHEVGVALCEVLERLPWEGRVGYEKMRALGGLKRYGEAAAAARASAGTMRSRGVRSEDGFWSAERMVQRARLYEALDAGDVSGFQWVAAESVRDPVILFVAGFYLRYFLGNPPLATRYAEDAVRATAGLHHPYRDLLAAQRISAGRPEQALRLLDPDRRLPVRRNAGANNRRFLMYLAKARLALGDTKGARRDLESALQDDKRILPEVLADPAFKLFADLYPEIESDYLDYCFRWGD